MATLESLDAAAALTSDVATADDRVRALFQTSFADRCGLLWICVGLMVRHVRAGGDGAIATSAEDVGSKAAAGA